MGFYEDPAERMPIRGVRLASDVPENVRIPLQVLRTDTQTFRDLIESHATGWTISTNAPQATSTCAMCRSPARATPTEGRIAVVPAIAGTIDPRDNASCL